MGGVVSLTNVLENLKSLTFLSLASHLKNGTEIITEYHFYIISVTEKGSS